MNICTTTKLLMMFAFILCGMAKGQQNAFPDRCRYDPLPGFCLPVIITTGNIGEEDCSRDEDEENNTTFRCSSDPTEADYLNSYWKTCANISICVKDTEEFEKLSNNKVHTNKRCNETSVAFGIEHALSRAVSLWKGVCVGFPSDASKFNVAAAECSQEYTDLPRCTIQIDLVTDPDE